MWNFFAQTAISESNFLSPDTYQIAPQQQEIYKISPTNIGLLLLSYLSAYDLKLISRNELTAKIKKTLNIIKSLKKFKGHLYNWYSENESLKPITPFFISTI